MLLSAVPNPDTVRAVRLALDPLVVAAQLEFESKV
jgi:hypothetical protein